MGPLINTVMISNDGVVDESLGRLPANVDHFVNLVPRRCSINVINLEPSHIYGVLKQVTDIRWLSQWFSFAGCFIRSLNSLEISIWPNAKRNDNYDIYSCHSSDTYHNGLVTPYGDMGLHWLGSILAQIMTYCLTAPIHSGTNIDFSLVRSCDSDLRAIHFFNLTAVITAGISQCTAEKINLKINKSAVILT